MALAGARPGLHAACGHRGEANNVLWELRHTFVSVLSDAGVPIEDISRLIGHKSTEVTKTVYWHQIRRALLASAEAMDDVFPAAAEDA